MKFKSTVLLCLASVASTFAANPPDRVEIETQTSDYNDGYAIMIKIVEEDESRPEDALLGNDIVTIGAGPGTQDGVSKGKLQWPLSDKNAEHQFYAVMDGEAGVANRKAEIGFLYRTDKNSYDEYASEYSIMIGKASLHGEDGEYQSLDGSGVFTTKNGKPILSSCYIKAGAREGFRLAKEVGVVVGYGVEGHGCAEWIDHKNNVEEDADGGYRLTGSMGLFRKTETSSVGIEAVYHSDSFGKNDSLGGSQRDDSYWQYNIKGSLKL